MGVKVISVRLYPKQQDKLQRISNSIGKSQSEVLRMLLDNSELTYEERLVPVVNSVESEDKNHESN